MRVVLDTNGIVAGLVSEGLRHEILEMRVPEHVVILSERLWDELLQVLRRKFDLGLEDLPLLALYRRPSLARRTASSRGTTTFWQLVRMEARPFSAHGSSSSG